MFSSILARILNVPDIQRQSMLSIIFFVLITITGFFSTILFSHMLGKDIMGAYYLFITYYGIFNLFGDAGFGSAAVKRISEGKNQDEYFSAYAVLRCSLLVVSTLLLLTLAPYFIDSSNNGLIIWVVIALVAVTFSGMISAGIMGLGHMGVYNVAFGVSEVTRILFQIIAVLLGFSLAGLCGGFIVGIIIIGAISFTHFTLKPSVFSVKILKNMFSYSFWIFLIASGSLVFTYADTLFISYYLSTGDVGIYRVALQFTGVSTAVTAAIVGTLTPKISYWSSNDLMEKIHPVISRGITWSLIISIPVALGAVILSKKLMYFFYGADFAAGSVVCSILFILQIVNVFVALFGVALRAADHAREAFITTVVAAVLNIILDILLIPLLGIEGAAIASVISMAVNAILIRHFLKRYINVSIEIKPILHIIAASLLMLGFILLYTLIVPLSDVILTLIPVGIGAGIYFTALFKFDRGIRNELVDMIKKYGLPWPEWI